MWSGNSVVLLQEWKSERFKLEWLRNYCVTEIFVEMILPEVTNFTICTYLIKSTCGSFRIKMMIGMLLRITLKNWINNFVTHKHNKKGKRLRVHQYWHRTEHLIGPR